MECFILSGTKPETAFLMEYFFQRCQDIFSRQWL